MATLRAAVLPALAGLGAAGCSFRAGALSPDSPLEDAPAVARPEILRPAEGQTFPAARTFLSWTAGEIPAGRTVAGFDLCSTTEGAAAIDDDSECPNAVMTTDPYFVLETPAESSYLVKLRAHYDDGSLSAFSAPLRSFSTGPSPIGRWRMNGNGTDASPSMNNGTVQNGASFGAGFNAQSLLLDGVNDFMTVPDRPAFDFGAGDFAFSAWVFTQSTPGNQVFLEKRDGANGYLFSRRTNGSLRFHGDQCGAFDAGNLSHDEWHHVMARRTGTNVSLSIDGAEAGTGTCNETFANAAELTFGCNTPTNGCTEPLKGQLDEVMILSAVSPESVLNEYCAGHVEGGTRPLPAACLP